MKRLATISAVIAATIVAFCVWYLWDFERLPRNQEELTTFLEQDYQYFCFFAAYAWGPDSDAGFDEDVYPELSKVIVENFGERFPIDEGPAILFVFDGRQKLISAHLQDARITC